MEDVVPDQLEHLLVQHREQNLHPGQEVAGHHVGRAHVHLGLSSVLEIVYPGMLQEAVDDAYDADVL